MSLQKALCGLILFIAVTCSSLVVCAQQSDSGVSIEEVKIADSNYVDEDYSDEEEVVDTILSSNINHYPKDSLRALLRQKEFAYISNLDSLLMKVQEENLQQLKKQKPPRDISWIFYFIKYLLLFIVITAVLFLIYRLFLSDKGMFAASVRNKHKNIAAEEIIDEDVLSRKASEAEQAGNYRMAIRYYYLVTLSSIAQKGWLQLSFDKTNYQYVRELTKKTIRTDFARITLHYEYAWYGNFKIDAVVYDAIKKEFSNLQTTINQS